MTSNRDRAERFHSAMCLKYHDVRRDDEESVTDVLTDVLTDAQHFCRYNGLDFDRQLRLARMHFETEQQEERERRHHTGEAQLMPTTLRFEDPRLMPEELAKTIPPLGATDDQPNPIAHVKFFTPDSSWTWYVVEYDPESKERVAWGLVYGGADAEMRDFCLDDLERARGPRGLPIERDPHFGPRPLSQCEDPTRMQENPLTPWYPIELAVRQKL